MFGIDADYNFTGKRPEIRYIKLGPNNRWAKDALRRGEIPFSFREVPHELALTGDEDRITAHLIGQGKAQGAARNAARQVCAFYGLDEDAVWVTFADGLMWWTTAKPEVVWLGESDDYAPRIRRCDGGWSSANRFDVPFEMSSLSSRLTKVASAQATICRIEAEDYLLRKILSVTEPSVRKAGLAKQAMIEAIEELIANLHWSDFETLVDLMLSRSGWHRVSALGGNMKDVDMIVEQAVIKEFAFVQVKSASNQAELDRYIATFETYTNMSRMIFACHSPSGQLSSSRRDVIIWARSTLAAMVLELGLFDWLVSRAG